MSSRRKFVLIFCFILLDMFLLIGFLVIRDATFLNTLRKEVNELSKLDITKDRYNTKIKSKGNYAIVEKAIKEYLDDYAVNLQEVSSVIQDPELTKILSYENYSTDGPEFKKSLSYLEKTKKDFNEKIDRLLENTEEEKISNYINQKISEPYYIDLYKELMLADDMVSEFNETRSLLEKTKVRVNNAIDVSAEVLNFLVTQKAAWSVEDGEIKFLTVDLYNYYTSLVGKLQMN